MTEPSCPNHRVAFYGRTNQTGTDDHRDVARRYVRCLPVILRLGWCWLAGWYYDLAVAPGRTQAHQAAVWDGGGPRCRDGGSSEPAAELALPQVHVVLLSDYERLPRQLRRCQPLMAACGRLVPADDPDVVWKSSASMASRDVDFAPGRPGCCGR